MKQHNTLPDNTILVACLNTVAILLVDGQRMPYLAGSIWSSPFMKMFLKMCRIRAPPASSVTGRFSLQPSSICVYCIAYASKRCSSWEPLSKGCFISLTFAVEGVGPKTRRHQTQYETCNVCPRQMCLAKWIWEQALPSASCNALRTLIACPASLSRLDFQTSLQLSHHLTSATYTVR